MDDDTIFSLLMESLSLICVVIAGFVAFFLSLIFPKKMKDLKGEVALVTGAGKGLGRELVRLLHSLGVFVICVDIDENSVKDTVSSLGSRSVAFRCDVSDPEDVEALTSDIERANVGNVTMLFNNAGIIRCKSFLDHSLEDVEAVYRVNLFSQIYLIKKYLPKFMERDKGHIVSTCSFGGVTGSPYISLYCSSKFAVRGLMESIFLEMRQGYPKSRVKFTTAYPYTINTGLVKKPVNRFNLCMPILSPEEAASNIIKAVRRDKESVYMPPMVAFISAWFRCAPRSVQLAIMDFFRSGVSPTD